MGIIDWAKKTENKYPVGIAAIILALIFFFFSPFASYYGTKPKISFEIINETNILDVHKPLKDLSIFFRGRNIQRENLNLKIYKIKITNNGWTSIKRDDYDPDLTWGFKVLKGQIIESRVVESNQPYINENMHPQVILGNEVSLNKIVFDGGKYFITENLILYNKNDPLKIVPIGKIAGLEEIIPTIVCPIDGKSPKSIKLTLISIVMTVLRLIFLFIVSIIVLIVILFTTSKIGDFRDKQNKAHRRNIVRLFLPTLSREEIKKFRELFDVYVNHGAGSIKRLQKLIASQDQLLLKVKTHFLKNEYDQKVSALVPTQKPNDNQINEKEVKYFSPFSYFSPVSFLLKKQYVLLENDSLKIDPDFNKTFNDFYEYLKKYEKTILT